MQTVKLDLKRAFGSAGFWIGVLGIALGGIVGASPALEFAAGSIRYGEGANSFMAIEGIFYSKVFLLAVPLFCALPFGGVFLEEQQSRFVLFSLPRAGFCPYILSKAGMAALSGGAAALLGSLAGVLYCVCRGYPDISEWSLLQDQLGQNGLKLMEMAAGAFMSGCLWGVAGALAALALKSRYMAFASPFVICYVLDYIQSRYLKSRPALNPMEWAAARSLPMETGLCILLAMSLLLAAVYGCLMEKRLRDE